MQGLLRKFEAVMGYEVRLRAWVICLALLLAGSVFAVSQNVDLLKDIYRIHIQGHNVFAIAYDYPEDAARFEGYSGFSGKGLEEERYLLLPRYDGNLREAVVELIDLRDFSVVHIWNPDFNAIRKEMIARGYKGGLGLVNEKRGILLLRPLLTRDLNLVFRLKSNLVVIDSLSELVSRIRGDGVGFHHSIEEDGKGNLWVPVRFCTPSLPFKWAGKGCGEQNYHDDGIMQLSPEGEVLFSKSLSEILIENDMIHLLFGVKSYHYDPIHLNDVQPVLEDGSFWKKGDVFLSIREQSMIMLYRPSSNKIIWLDAGHTLRQHDINILDESRISIFDNNRLHVKSGDRPNGPNRMVIYDFATDQYSTYLEEAMARKEMRTPVAGQGQILPDGDLLAEETVYGRLLYFKADGALKWRFVNRASDGRLYRVDRSRILYQPQDIKRVRRLLNQTGQKAS